MFFIDIGIRNLAIYNNNIKNIDIFDIKSINKQVMILKINNILQELIFIERQSILNERQSILENKILAEKQASNNDNDQLIINNKYETSFIKFVIEKQLPKAKNNIFVQHIIEVILSINKIDYELFDPIKKYRHLGCGKIDKKNLINIIDFDLKKYTFKKFIINDIFEKKECIIKKFDDIIDCILIEKNFN